MKFLVWPACAGLLALASAQEEVAKTAAGSTDIVAGQRHVIRSTVFGQERALCIYTPTLHQEEVSFPVFPFLYLVDGEGPAVRRTASSRHGFMNPL